MPVYLVHGFRWGRVSIRHHVILNNVDGGAPEYIQNPDSAKAILDSLKVKYPEIMRDTPPLTFIEQYDPNDTSSKAQSQPHAYVCDIVFKDDLSIYVNDAQAKGMSVGAWHAMADLRDKLADGSPIGWFVVYNGDEHRAQVEASVRPGSKNGKKGLRKFFSRS
ncbi:MAG: hypothetical protein Q9191_002837 [Dirinaria sp. TL-2023a]